MRLHTRVLTAFAPLLLALPATAQSIDEHVVDSIIAAQMTQRRLVGVSVAMVRGGNVVLSKGYGASQLDPRIPVDTSTRFSIGSVTKEFVAALMLLLQEDGKLSVTDPLSKWYPAITRSKEITLLDLVNHVSGYRDYYPLDFVDREMSRSTSADAIISEYATKPLDFEPGTRWSYSNTGYTLVGRVLERVGGKPLGVMLQERIFTPLGMRQTAFDPSFTERVAKGYSSWALNEHEVAAPEGSGWTGAAGAIWSNANDLARWDLALMRPGFLTPASREILFRERILRNGVPTGYAAGLSVSRDAGRTIISHGGATSGFSATNMFVPQDTAAVVVLSNYDENVTAGALLPLVSPRRVDNDAQPARPTQTPVPPPTPKGPPALQAALDFFTALQRGSVNRSGLTPDYAAFLTPKKVAQASKSLSSLGEPTNAVLLGVRERGGMQVAGVRLTFPNRVVRISMYRAPSGAMEQFLLW